MEDRSSQRSVCPPLTENFDERLRVASAARSDHGDADRAGNRSRQRALEPRACTITIHRGQKNLSCAAVLCFACPVDSISARRLSSASDKHLITVIYTLRVNRNHHGLGAVALRDARDQSGI